MRNWLKVAPLACVCLFLSGCGHKSDATQTGNFSISGTLSGLSAGAQITVNDNGGDPVTLTTNGGFSFDAPVTSSGGYLVSVVDQPAGETCTVSNYSGTALTANVTNVSVMCSGDTYPIGGMVSGLASGTQVVLHDNGADALTVATNGAFTFATPVSYEGSYSVTVGTQPTGQTCTVAKGAGVSVIAPVSTISIVCATETFSIGGNVTGLNPGAQITLDNNGADPDTITANGSFSFATPVAYNGTYNVTTGTQPTGQTCTVANGSGIATAIDITNITVACSTNTFTVSGSVSGLAAGTQLVLDDNGADPLTLTAGGSFTFAAPVSYNGSFDVTVGTQPTGQTCTVGDGVGTLVSSNVTGVSVVCAADTYTIGGSVSGLTANGLVLKNNGDDALPVSVGSTSFQFDTPVAYGSGYSVTVFQQPPGQTCTVEDGVSTTVNANVTMVGVSCLATAPTVSSATPNNGPASGGTAVTIIGSGFAAGATSVTINGNVVPASSLTVNSSTSLTVITPASAAGNVALSVTTPGGTSSNVPGGFTYEGPPTISCSAYPATVFPGESTAIISEATSPGGLSLTFSYSATAGSISGNSSIAILNTVGAAPGTITISCNVADSEGNVASAATTVTVIAPPPP